MATATTALHIVALLIGGGIAVSADRTFLRSGRVDERAAAHRPVQVSLVVLFVSGVMMALADLETFLTSPFFWIKLALVAALIVNGLFLMRAERSSNIARLRATSRMSFTLWVLTAIAGTVLTNA